MEKLRLVLDDLAVTSFSVEATAEEHAGTVEAREFAPTRPTKCGTCASVCDTCVTLCGPAC